VRQVPLCVKLIIASEVVDRIVGSLKEEHMPEIGDMHADDPAGWSM